MRSARAGSSMGELEKIPPEGGENGAQREKAPTDGRTEEDKEGTEVSGDRRTVKL